MHDTPPNPSRKGHQLTWTFTEHRVTIALDRWREDKAGLNAECTVCRGPGLILAQGRLNLSSLPTRRQWAKTLGEKTRNEPALNWDLLLELVCSQALKAKREAEPVEPLNRPASPIVIPWRLSPIVHEGLPTVLFGPAGLGKSNFALFTAMIVEQGGHRGALSGVPGRTLYLDWEMDRLYLQDRAERLRIGHPDLSEAEPLYRRCETPLADDLTELAELVQTESIAYLVIDSLAPACGSDLAAPETALRFFRALRSLRLPALVLAHVAKNSEQKSIYGSVFFTNLARSVWEIEGDGDGKMALYHRKSNLTARQTALGYQVSFTSDSIHFEGISVDEMQTVKEEAGSRRSIEDALLEGPKTVSEVAAHTSLSEATVRAVLNRGKMKRYVKMNNGAWALLNLGSDLSAD